MTVAATLLEMKEAAAEPLSLEGSSSLGGSVMIQGAKNSALKVIPALAAIGAQYSLRRVPLLLDVLEELSILEYLGGKVILGENEVFIDTRDLENRPIPREMTRGTTAAFYFAGSLLSRFGRASVGLPGGDEIGPRPVDFHVAAFEALGATVVVDNEMLHATLDSANRPSYCTVDFGMPSAGATVNAVLAALDGCILDVVNPPRDADTKAFFDFLRESGTTIEAFDDRVRCGPRASISGKITFTLPSDRNDALTWLTAGALSKDGVLLSGADAQDLEAALTVWRSLGVRIDVSGEDIRVASSGSLVIPPDMCVVAGASPGFHSDWAPFLQLLLTQSQGVGTTVDVLHAARVRQAEVLSQMGADLSISGGDAPGLPKLHFRQNPAEARYIVEIRGPSQLRGLEVSVGNDVRACATIALAACVAHGPSALHDMYAIARGYERFGERLRAVTL